MSSRRNLGPGKLSREASQLLQKTKSGRTTRSLGDVLPDNRRGVVKPLQVLQLRQRVLTALRKYQRVIVVTEDGKRRSMHPDDLAAELVGVKRRQLQADARALERRIAERVLSPQYVLGAAESSEEARRAARAELEKHAHSGPGPVRRNIPTVPPS